GTDDDDVVTWGDHGVLRLSSGAWLCPRDTAARRAVTCGGCGSGGAGLPARGAELRGERPDVGDRAEVGELVRVGDVADGPHPAVDDVERERLQHPALPVACQGPGLAVDLAL